MAKVWQLLWAHCKYESNPYTTVSCKPAICISLNIADTEISLQLMKIKKEKEGIKYLYFRGRKMKYFK